MRKKERWKARQCYICCLHILYKRKQKKRKKNNRQGIRKEGKRKRSLSLKEDIQITRVVDLNFIVEMLQLAKGKGKKIH
jgi:hypothetical protein